MTRRVWDGFLKHESPRDVPPSKGTIKGVPFVDTPRDKTPFVTVRLDVWEDAQRAANAGRWGLAVGFLMIAIAIIWVSNIGV
jgi:hypothetical protein